MSAKVQKRLIKKVNEVENKKEWTPPQVSQDDSDLDDVAGGRPFSVPSYAQSLRTRNGGIVWKWMKMDAGYHYSLLTLDGKLKAVSSDSRLWNQQ